MIDRATVDRIIDAAQIYDVVSQFVSLRKRGVNYVGLCPFHEDKNPSFYVSPAKGVCKCFACGKGGNAVHFIMEHEQLTYVEALKFLAKKYGIEVKERELTDEEKQAQTDRESLFVVNQFARDYFRNTLRNHREGQAVGLAYFHNRGFRDDVIERFQLGYSTEQRDGLAKEALRRGYRKDFLIRTGLCYETEDGRLLDRFHGRVIFPVLTLSGKVVAFGGRVLASATKGVKAKYVNSIESEIYHKSDELYGLYTARQAIAKADRCFLVEGYTDVISMAQAGVENVVASSGTALTKGQIKLIRRFTDNVTVLYDGDEAGIKASLRGIDLLLENRLNVKVCLLPDGEDPDSLARRLSAQDLRKFLDEHQTDFIRFKTTLLLKEAGNDPIQRARLVESVVNSIAVIPEAIARDIYIKECAQLLGMEDRLLVSEVAKRREKARQEKRTEQERKAEQDKRKQEADNTPGQTTLTPQTSGTPQVSPTPQTPGTQTLHSPASKQGTTREGRLAPYERALLQAVVRYGERVLYVEEAEGEASDNNPTEAESGRAVRVVDYVTDALEEDDIELCLPLHRLMLAEAKQAALDPAFRAEHFFRNHPDAEVSRLSTDLISDRYELSKYHAKHQQVVPDEERLFEIVPTLITNYKYAVVAETMRDISHSLQDPAVWHDQARCNELMKRYDELRRLQSQMAKALGDRVVMRV